MSSVNSSILDLIATQARALDGLGPTNLWRDQMRAQEDGASRRLATQVQHEVELRLAVDPTGNHLARFRQLSADLQADRERRERLEVAILGPAYSAGREAAELKAKLIADMLGGENPSAYAKATMAIGPALLREIGQAERLEAVYRPAFDAARLAQSIRLPGVLEAIRTSEVDLAVKLGLAADRTWLDSSAHLAAFAATSSLADIIGHSFRVDAGFTAATAALAATQVPKFESLSGYRAFLDAAGLGLSRWPRVRLLTRSEKRQRFKSRLRENVEPPHVKRAKSLVHRYERTLREVIEEAMTETYGDDWPQQRLPLCNCKDLLKRWEHRGGDVLDHADFAHYVRIMSAPEHFSAIFEAGFDDPEALADVLRKAGRLRARSHHPHEFTPDDLRDLRLTWRTIETGLIALPMVEFVP